jgi:glycosyltransferase involved in cell wall biosynthesis
VSRARRAASLIGPGKLAGCVFDARVTQESLVVQGWAALPAGDIQAVWVTIDGVVFGLAERGRPTPQDAFGVPLTSWSTVAGWQATIDRELITPGSHLVGALALRGYGLVEILEPRPALIPEAMATGGVDEPLDGAIVDDFLVVRGWFLSGHGYDRVEISVDGTVPVRARLLANSRPDIAAQSGDPDAPLAGWDAFIPLKPGDGSDLNVVVDAVSTDGSRLKLCDRTLRHEHVDRPVVDPRRADVLEARTSILASGHTADTDRVNLLVATHHLTLGGGQLYLQELLRQLLRHNDITCTVLSMWDGVLRDELEELGARVHIVGPSPSSSVPYEDWLHQVAALVTTTRSNVVLANSAQSYWAVDLAARIGIPSVLAVHESFAPEVFMQVGLSRSPDARVRGRFLDAFGQAGAVVFEADATLRLFEHLIRDGRGVRVDYGIDLDRVHAFATDNPRQTVRDRLGVKLGETLLVCMGTYEPRKAQGLLATAFAQVVDEYPRAVLAMIGARDDSYSGLIRTVVDNLGIADRVRLVPVTPDIEDWYLAADAFILASDVESLPRSMLEAMAFGAPILGSEVFGVPEVVEDGVNGFLFEPSSVTSAVQVMRRALRLSNEERAKLGEAGRQLVEATRSSATYARAYRIIFSELLAGGNDIDLASALGNATAGSGDGMASRA